MKRTTQLHRAWGNFVADGIRRGDVLSIGSEEMRIVDVSATVLTIRPLRAWERALRRIFAALSAAYRGARVRLAAALERVARKVRP